MALLPLLKIALAMQVTKFANTQHAVIPTLAAMDQLWGSDISSTPLNFTRFGSDSAFPSLKAAGRCSVSTGRVMLSLGRFSLELSGRTGKEVPLLNSFSAIAKYYEQRLIEVVTVVIVVVEFARFSLDTGNRTER